MSEAPPFPAPTKRWHSTEQPSTSPTRPELSAKGKSVIITGGGTGIGGATARSFAEAGASRIALLGRREKPILDNKAFIEAKFPGTEVFAMSIDIAKKTDVDATFSRFSGDAKIDVLVHSAAIIGPNQPVAVVDGEKYLEAAQENISGSFWVAQAFLRHAAPDAVAISINSSGIRVNFNELFSSYCVAKAAIHRLWDTVAFANPNLSVFHTQPGVVLTEMNLKAGGAASVKNIKTDDGEWAFSEGLDHPLMPISDFDILDQCLCLRASTFGSRARRPGFSRASFCGATGMWMNSRPRPRVSRRDRS